MHEIVLVCLLAVAAYFVQGITGAGSAIVFNTGMLLALAFGAAGSLTLLDGIYWVALTDALTGVFMAALLWRELKPDAVTWRVTAGLIQATVVFTVALTLAAPVLLAAVLAGALVLAGLWLCVRRETFGSMPSTVARRWAFPTGLLAGVLGGLFGMAGPVTFFLIAPASQDPAEFRQRGALVFGLTNLVRVGLLAALGVFTVERLQSAAWSLPVVFAATLAGVALHRHARPGLFRVGLGVLVALGGLSAMIRMALG